MLGPAVKKYKVYNKQAGVSLIEVLVTTLILGIGLLGVAALQVSSISSSQEGLFQSQATSLAEDLASRMRAAKIQTLIDPPGNNNDGTPKTAMAYEDYLKEFVKKSNPVECPAKSAPPPDKCRAGSGGAPNACNFIDMVAYDLADVCWNAKQVLPNSKLRVFLPADSNRLTIVVDWDSASARTGSGQKKNINANCKALTNNDERNCIIMEIVP
ncbi:type IV pilus modification protein PilV [Aliikangiella sp. IMCC44359]|uniref:type IV pilus modification protein PilV n=1 Tax=Aliikangiella sp. IMCC44359 TaxID=3459125 RepID=UPI00403A955C